MISIITAIHNQLGMNKLFYEYLVKYTSLPFELIIIDNASTDGSYEFFKGKPNVNIIRNNGNYSYPFCQNQGIQAARYDLLAFFNNDLIVSKNWDIRVQEVLNKNNLDVVSCLTTDCMETEQATRVMQKKWRIFKYPFIAFWGTGYWSLKCLFKSFFPSWERFTEKRYKKYKETIQNGLSGSCVIFRKNVLEKIGMWDERLLGADFDLYLRCAKRKKEYGDIKLPQLIRGVYLHHFVKLSRHRRKVTFIDQANLISRKDKWTEEELREFLQGSGMY